MPRGFFRAAVHRTKRYREIVNILAKYGFSDFIRAIKLDRYFPFLKKVVPTKDKRPLSEYTFWEHVRMVFEELGPTYIKLAQIISSRRDLLPGELIVELEKLQDRVPPFPADQAVEIVEEELGRPLDEVFIEF